MRYPKDFVDHFWSLGGIPWQQMPERIKARPNRKKREQMKKNKRIRTLARKARRTQRQRGK